MAVIFVRHVRVPAPFGEQSGHDRLVMLRVAPGESSRWAMCRTEFPPSGGFRRRRWMLHRTAEPVQWTTWPKGTELERDGMKIALPPPPEFKPQTILKFWDTRTRSWRIL